MIDASISAGDVFSGLAFILSCYATWVTVRFNSRQKGLIESQERLNQMLLGQAEREVAESAKAELGVTFVKLGRNRDRLKIWNKGKASARNVRMSFPDGNEILIPSEIDAKFPLEHLDQYQSVELIAAPHSGTRLKHTVELTWDDDSGNGHSRIFYPTL